MHHSLISMRMAMEFEVIKNMVRGYYYVLVPIPCFFSFFFPFFFVSACLTSSCWRFT